MTPTVIGTITIGEGETFEQSYEVAAWRTTVALTPGTYDVTASNPHSYVEFGARIPGVVTSSYTAALLCGVPVGSSPQWENHPDVGKPREIWRRCGLDRITLNDTGREKLARFWIVGPRHREFSGPGLVVSRHPQIVPVDEVWGMEWRIDPNNGDLTEFTDEVSLLVERVNELQAEGFDPDVWRVTYGDDRKPWFESPYEDHRPYSARKFRSTGAMGEGSKHWRYYRPDYKPARSY